MIGTLRASTNPRRMAVFFSTFHRPFRLTFLVIFTYRWEGELNLAGGAAMPNDRIDGVCSLVAPTVNLGKDWFFGRRDSVCQNKPPREEG